jgi:hypothetical protein
VALKVTVVVSADPRADAAEGEARPQPITGKAYSAAASGSGRPDARAYTT